MEVRVPRLIATLPGSIINVPHNLDNSTLRDPKTQLTLLTLPGSK